ncbi:hypothetical protein HS7_17120 [Sulfolobales archaeon HS-7]|nr:hypothetical protein HS7_17120 [Sulfolobales archaeon HS-7]
MWYKRRVINEILDVITRRNASITDKDLYKELSKALNDDIPFSDFMKALMALEMRGYISVSTINEDTKMISLLGGKE